MNNVKDKYLKYCSDLFDYSVALDEANEKIQKGVLSASELAKAQADKDKIEKMFLACCQNIRDEYNSTNPKTKEVKGLYEFMNAIHQGHYHTI